MDETGEGDRLPVEDAPEARLSTRLGPLDDPAAVLRGVVALFSEVGATDWPEGLEQPTWGKRTAERIVELKLAPEALMRLVERCGEQRILNAALDAMAIEFDRTHTRFSLDRAAAWAGRVSFVLGGEHVSAGVFEVILVHEDLARWLEAATWHPGRRIVPRQVHDDLAMDADGQAPLVD